MRALYAVVGLAVATATYFTWGYFATGHPASGPTEPIEFRSGPQVGSKVPGAFEPLNVNGPDAGDEACVFCKYGNDPVVMVFATRPTEQLAALVRKIEKGATEAAKDHKVGACIILTDVSPATNAALTKLANQENLKQVLLGVIEPAKLKRYELHPDAEVTVLLYSKQVVRANHAYKAGELTEKSLTELAAETATFLASP